MIDKIYIVEKTNHLAIVPKFEKYLKPSIADTELEIKKKNRRIVEYTNGAKYEIKNKLLTLSNGEKFKGVMSEDLKSMLKGAYFWPNNQEYDGVFNEKNNFDKSRAEGTVSSLKMEKSTYKGEFVNGLFDGEGIYTFKEEGITIQGSFTEGKIDGKVFIEDTNINYTFDGNFSNGVKDGPAEIKRTIGNYVYSIKGTFKENKKEGDFEIVKIEPEDDKKEFNLTGTYKNDKRDGYFDLIDVENHNNYEQVLFPRSKIILAKEINLYNKQLTEDNIKKIFNYNLDSLITLNLARNKIKTLDFLDMEIPSLHNLEKLYLHYNQIKSIEIFKKVVFPKLRILNLGNNKITSVECLTSIEFKELENIDLSSNDISSLSGFENINCPKLRVILLNRTKINDITPLTKSKLPLLSELDLHSNKIFKPKNISPLVFKDCPLLVKIKL